MATVLKQLGQVRPVGTSPVGLYSPGSGVSAVIKTIVICNNTGSAGSAANFSIYCDDDGAVFTVATALYLDVVLNQQNTTNINLFLPMNDSSGNLAVATSVANNLTFTAFGVEQT